MLEALSWKIISDGLEELVYADDLTYVCESLEGLKRGLEANVSKREKMIRIENAGKVTEEGKFLCAVSSKGVGSDSILCQFSRWWVYKRYSDIRDILKENSKFKCHIGKSANRLSTGVSRHRIKQQGNQIT